jgi:hypothetical protein
VTNIGYCIREIYSFIKIHTNNQWQLLWETNSGKSQLKIQPKIDRHPKCTSLPSKNHNRVINRLRTGKTLLQSNFKKYLKSRSLQSTKCSHCPKLETLEHIFNQCPTYKVQCAKFHQKQRYIKEPTHYPELLKPSKNPNLETTHKNIIEYLAEISKVKSQ